MFKRNKDKETNKNSMINTVSSQSKNTGGLFKGIISGFKDTLQILKNGPKPNQKITPFTIILSVLSVAFVVFMLVRTIMSFGG